MSAIQVKNVPVTLHERLRERARSEGRSLSDYVLEVLQRDLTMPTMREWLDQLERDEPVTGLSSREIVDVIHASRTERDAQIRSSIADRD